MISRWLGRRISAVLSPGLCSSLERGRGGGDAAGELIAGNRHQHVGREHRRQAADDVGLGAGLRERAIGREQFLDSLLRRLVGSGPVPLRADRWRERQHHRGDRRQTVTRAHEFTPSFSAVLECAGTWRALSISFAGDRGRYQRLATRLTTTSYWKRTKRCSSDSRMRS